MLNRVESALLQLRQTKPMVLCLTNYVTMDFMANALLALGAAAIMSTDEREIEKLIAISHAVNINIGTLEPEFVKRCTLAVEIAKHYKKPVVLDPVGSGASSIRTKTARELMRFADIIRGNASEIMALLEEEHKTFGVESMHQVSEAKDFANKLAKTLDCTVVVSGEEDYITDGVYHNSLKYGSFLMPLVIGMGCSLSAVIAAFRAVILDSYEASTLATAYFSLCGSLTQKTSAKPGTFRATFMDELYAANFKEMRQLCVK